MSLQLYNQIILGDCLEKMKEIPDNTVDLIVTSPPYNNWRNRRTQKRKEDYWKRTNIFYEHHDDKMTDVQYMEWQVNIINEMLRILKPTGTICYNHKDQIFNFEVISPLKWIFKTNAVYRQRVTWDRMGMQAFNNVRFYRVEEDIYILGKQQKPFKYNKKFSNYNSIWRILPSRKEYDSHPASFPLELPKRCIQAFTELGDLVLDPFNGVGKTCIASKKLGRNYIGIDNSISYCKRAEESLLKTKRDWSLTWNNQREILTENEGITKLTDSEGKN